MSEAIIKKIQLDRLYNQEHIEFNFEVSALIGTVSAELLHAADLIPKHTARLETLDVALKRIIKSQRTEQIHAADKERDDTYRGLTGFNKAMTMHHDRTIREAAARLQIVTETYGTVLTMNYEEETGTLYNLIQDLKSDKYAADAAAVGLTPWILKLEERNNAFKELLSARDQETAAGTHHIVVKEARRNLDKIYARFRNRVNSYVDDEVPNPALDAFITQLNIIVKRFNTLAARRKAGKKGGGKGADAPEGDNQ